MQRLLFVTFLCLENARAHITLVPSFGGEAGNYFQTSIKVRWCPAKHLKGHILMYRLLSHISIV